MFYIWGERYGKANEQDAHIPLDYWIEDWKRDAIIRFAIDNHIDVFRRLTYDACP